MGALVWSGLTPTLLMSVPSTILYLTAYEAAELGVLRSLLRRGLIYRG